MPASVEGSFLDFLYLDPQPEDVFVGRCHAGAPRVAFGGQLVAQALLAAGETIDDDERSAHSLHAYFINPVVAGAPVSYHVDRVRDGRTFSARHISAYQDSVLVFRAMTSFCALEQGPDHTLIEERITGPDGWPSIPLPVTDHRPELAGQGYPATAYLDVRVVDAQWLRDATESRADEAFWVRIESPIPERSLLHVAALSYITDMRLDRTSLARHGGAESRSDLQVTSIDHSLWIHRPFVADDWLLAVHTSPSATAGHGFNRAEIFDLSGVLVASAAQENLIRPASPACSTR